jgi:PKD repeat protein
MPTVPVGRSPRGGTTNFVTGSDPVGWTSGLSTFAQVSYEGLYEGIDLVYRLEGGLPKYDLLLAPGADPSAVSFVLEGHDGLSLTARGDLVVHTPAGPITDTGLVAFYADDPSEVVDCAFEVRGTDTYGFTLGPRDVGRAVVIDPLVYSTFLGGANGEWELPSGGVAVDLSGRAVVSGFANTTDFPTTPGAFQVDNAGGNGDVFVFRLTAAGDDLEWSTYIGGDGYDYAYDIALDRLGHPVVVGKTNSSDFPTTGGTLRPNRSGSDQEGFVLKLEPDGSGLRWSTYFGGNDTDEVTAVVVDDLGDFHIVGNTLSEDLPTSSWALQQNLSGMYDAFLARLRSDGTDIVSLTYLGGSLWDIAQELAVDESGSAYIVGQTYSANMSTTGAFCETMGGSIDAFACKVSPMGSFLRFFTYLGGLSSESANFVGVAPNNTVTVAGSTLSSGFPVTNGSYQTLFGGKEDTFLLRLAANGSELEYSTLYGGNQSDTCEGFWMDATGSTYFTGRTFSNNTPTLRGALQEEFGGVADAYVARLNAAGTDLLYGSYLGGTRYDVGLGIALDLDGNAYVAGGTESVDFPVTSGAYQEAVGGRVDVFVAKIDLFLDLEAPVAVPGTDIVIDMGETVIFNGSASTDNVGVVNWTWNFTYDGAPVTLYGPEVEWTFDIAGKYYIWLSVFDAVGNVGTEWVSVWARDIEGPVAVASDDIYGQQHWSITLDGTRSSDNVGIASYVWTFVYGGENVTLEGDVVQFEFRDAGTYPVTLNVSDAAGNWDTATFTVFIQDITPPVVEAGEDVTVDQHVTVTFNSTGTSDNVGVVNHTWFFVYRGVPIYLYGPSPHFTFDKAGAYEVSLKVVDAVDNQAVDQLTVTVLDITPPDVVAGNDALVDQGQTVTLDGTGSSDNVRITSWNWTIVLGDEVTNFTGSRTSFTFAAAGVYTITLNVTDEAGNWATDAFTITVRDTTDPDAVAGEDLEVDQDTPMTFDGTASSDNVGIISYTWTFEEHGSTVTLTGPEPSYTFESFGTYTVTLTVVDASGRSDTDEIKVTVVDTEPPVAVANPPQKLKEGGTAHFNASGSSDNSGIWTYVWSFNYNQAPIELPGDEASYKFQLKGNYTVTLTVTDLSGNVATAVTYVEVVGEGGDINGNGDGDGDVGRALYLYLLMFGVIVIIALVAVGLLMRRPKGDFGWTPSEDERAEKVVGAEEEEDADEELEDIGSILDEVEAELDNGDAAGEEEVEGTEAEEGEEEAEVEDEEPEG